MDSRIEEWLSEYHNPETRKQFGLRLRKFLEENNTTLDQLAHMESKEAKHTIKTYVANQQAKGMCANTVIARINGVRAFLTFLGKELKFKRSDLPRIEAANNKHVFSNGDLGKLFDCGSTRAKAIISLGVSLGWAISDVLALDRKFVETLIERAKEENEQFIFFQSKRIKTGAKSFGVLNPLAIEWLSKWLAVYNGEKLFDICEDMINVELKKLAKESQLKLTGEVSFHCFRAWTFNSLIRAGFSEYSSKLIVGKSIPITDGTYLSLEDSIKETYPQKYDKYFNIKPSENGEAQKKFLAVQENLEKENQVLKDRIEGLQKIMEAENKALNQKVEEVWQEGKLWFNETKRLVEFFDRFSTEDLEELRSLKDQRNKVEAHEDEQGFFARAR